MNRHMLKSGLALGLLCFWAISGWAQVYKCTGAGGAVALQQMPCAAGGEKLDVKPAAGPAYAAARSLSPADGAERSAAQAGAGEGMPKSYSQQYEAMKLERERRQGWDDMQSKRAAIDAVRARCLQEQRQIESEKKQSNNNLAGATRDVAISSRMQAAATLCDSRIRSAERDHDQAMATCEKIKCIAPP